MPGVSHLPGKEAAKRWAQSPAPPHLAPSVAPGAASGRAGQEGHGRHFLAELGPGQQRFPVASSRAASGITSSGSHSGKELQSPWEWEWKGAFQGPSWQPRCPTRAGVTPPGSACRATAARAAGFRQLFGVTGPGWSRPAAGPCPWPAGYPAGRGSISRAGNERLGGRGRSGSSSLRNPSPSGSCASVSPTPVQHPPWFLAPSNPAATRSTGHKWARDPAPCRLLI